MGQSCKTWLASTDTGEGRATTVRGLDAERGKNPKHGLHVVIGRSRRTFAKALPEATPHVQLLKNYRLTTIVTSQSHWPFYKSRDDKSGCVCGGPLQQSDKRKVLTTDARPCIRARRRETPGIFLCDLPVGRFRRAATWWRKRSPLNGAAERRLLQREAPPPSYRGVFNNSVLWQTGLRSRRFLGGVGVGFFCPTPDVQLDHFLHHTAKLKIPVEMAQFLLKLLLTQRFLAVHHDFHWF